MRKRYFAPLIILGLLMRFFYGHLLLAQADQEFQQKIEEAKSKLEMGVNTWNPELLKSARDLFLSLYLKTEGQNIFLSYYIALADYRLATYYFSKNIPEEVDRYNSEGKKYLEKAMEQDPSFGEDFALYATLLGYEIGLHPDRAMTLGPKSFEYFAKAFEKEPNNPRIHLLQGISDLYTPEVYGGGVAKAMETLSKSVSLFEKENIKDPLKPSWGREEAYTFLGLAYEKKNDFEKARELLKKALEINPDYAMAKRELSKIEKN